MKRSSLFLMFLTALTPTVAEPRPLAGLTGAEHSAALQVLVDRAAADAVTKFAGAKLKPEELAVTLVDVGNPGKPAWASHRGAVEIYPASVVKLFYLAATHQWLEDGRLSDSAEVRRAMSDMIVESHNEATHYLIDLLTGTTSGPELPDAELKEWFEKRNAVSRHFAALGFTGVTAHKKPWCEGPYGRESQAIRAFTPRRNMLTTEATARLLTETVTGRSVTPARSAEMLKLLERDPFAPVTDPEDQAHGFTGIALRPGMKLWSKAGWTSQTRHDAACVELTNGRKFVLVTFTENHAKERGIIPAVARVVIEGMANPR